MCQQQIDEKVKICPVCNENIIVFKKEHVFNQDQYEMLLRCSENKDVIEWNEWRDKNPNKEILLEGANLNKAFLEEVNFRKAELSKAKFQKANLTESNFARVYGQFIDFYQACLWGANLKKAILDGSIFLEALLIDIDLRRALLDDCCFNRANLQGAKLKGAKLHKAEFEGALLEGADLKEAGLWYTNLCEANLEKAILTGITFCRNITEGWQIKDVKCDYIYLDPPRKKRHPPDRDFEPGEFEILFKSIPTVEYVFKQGMKWYDALVMNQVAIDLNEKNPELGVQLLSLDGRGLQPRAIFSVSSNEKSEIALKEITVRYEGKIKQLETRIDNLIELLLLEREQPRQITIGKIDGNFYQAKHNINFDISNFIQSIEEIKEIVEKDKTLREKTKTHILNVLKDTLKDTEKGLIKEAGKKVITLAETELAPIAWKMAAQLLVLKKLSGLFWG